MEPKIITNQRTEIYDLGNDAQKFARDYTLSYVLYVRTDSTEKDQKQNSIERVVISAYTIGTGPGGSMDSHREFMEIQMSTREGCEPQREQKKYLPIPSDITDKFSELPEHVKKLL